MSFSACAARIALVAALFPLAAAGDAPPRPLDARGLDNLAAFTRLLGYVRFFHPSDQAAAADWDQLALAGVGVAEGARTPEELARALEDFFRPVAPTLRVYPTAGPRPALPAGLTPLTPPTPPAGNPRPEIVHWEHQGVNLGPGSNVYKSARISGPGPRRGQVQQSLGGGEAAFGGRRVTLRGMARLRGACDGAAVLRLRAYDPRQTAFLLAESKAPRGGKPADDWRPYEVTADVPADSTGLEVDLGLDGEGSVWWDDVSLAVSGRPATEAPPLDNGGFEEANPPAIGGAARWDLPWEARRAGYAASLSEEHRKSGRRSLLLTFTPPDPAALPRPEEPLVADLGGGVSALIPLALYKDEQGTLPHAAAAAPPARPEGFVPSGDDRTTRLADVALAWPVFQHFYPYFDGEPSDWPAELRRALTAAATESGVRAFARTLLRMVAALHDGHGGVNYRSPDPTGQIPLLWEWVEDQLVVTRVAAGGAGGLQPGDVVLTVGGRPAAEAIAAAEAVTSGATPQWRRWNSVHRLGMGKQGEAVRLEARHPGSAATFTADLTRSLPAFGPGSLEEARPDQLAELKPGILYLDVTRLEAGELRPALDRLAAARGIVFDLRGYPAAPQEALVLLAHLTDRPVSTELFNVPVVTRPDRQGWQWDVSSWSIQPRLPRLRARAAVLTDGRAVSFAETFLRIVETYRLAAIVGAPTAGTNGNTNAFALPGGYRVVWTGMKVLLHDGSPHHGIGIHPTVPAARTIAGVAAGRDEVLERGIAAVGG